MMNYKEFYSRLNNCGLISLDWRHLLELIKGELTKENNADNYLKILTLYFSLIKEGNVYMSLESSILETKLNSKIEKMKVEFEEKDEDRSGDFGEIISEIETCYASLTEIAKLKIVGKDKLFVVDNNRLFTRKFHNAVEIIKKSKGEFFKKNATQQCGFDYRSILDKSKNFSLSDGQEDVLKKGLYNNLIITGGPGTGKTTSIFFLLYALLDKDLDYNVYMAAPSGKAASRMKESVLKSEDFIDTACANTSVMNKIRSLDEYTIHRLLEYNYATNGFKRNEKNPFSSKSIFVIDEASMIDVAIFAALMKAIPEDARIFIMGDKNQLPSVECGAVFGELIGSLDKENIIELSESKRFPSNSAIYKLSEAVNNGEELPVSEDDWKTYDSFEIENAPSEITPIYYYKDEADSDGKMIEAITEKWFKNFYNGFQEICVDVDPSDKDTLNEIISISEKARILCACNETVRGVEKINKLILKNHFSGDKISGYYPGELLMVTKNNKSLGIYNGDNGVAVKFKNDDMLYVMFKKSSDLNDEKLDNKIFRLGSYVFYPLRMISRDEITSSFAISIHKSQGSDYENILVILPKLKGHPLLNRQIVYTAITRTKGSTYILSNQENLEHSRDTVLIRDTGIK